MLFLPPTLVDLAVASVKPVMKMEQSALPPLVNFI
jgi:hypothetical protein